ncbi:MAG: hypothetical protein K0U49_05175 [Alphaproteobacteria bacterium]|nr:hypothetical protein [Alphaproteobacteria bacterium]MCH9832743.1 hypothetical protein [Alphaproteobacteria bacterium]
MTLSTDLRLLMILVLIKLVVFVFIGNETSDQNSKSNLTNGLVIATLVIFSDVGHDLD